MNEQTTWWDGKEPTVPQNIDMPGLRPGRYLTLQERFEEWLASEDGQRVYDEVILRSASLMRRGFTHYPIDGLWHAIRYDYDIRVGPDMGFKLNNNHRSRMARRVMADVPELLGFFETRELTA